MRLFWDVLAAVAVGVLLWGAVVNAQTCYEYGHSCGGATTTECCPGLVCGIQGSTVKRCIQPDTSTTIPTVTTTQPVETTTTQPSGPTTTTTLPSPNPTEYGFLFSPYDLRVTDDEPAGFTGHLVDPRDGLPANQLLLATMGWQYMAYSMEAVALADNLGCDFNDQQIEDANFKFGADYVLKHAAFPQGGTYEWMQPTYVRQYTLAPIIQIAECLRGKGALPQDLAQIAGLAWGMPSPAPSSPIADIKAGMLSYVKGHYPPLTSAQCAALHAAEDAHMVHDQALLDHNYALAEAINPPVAATQRAFEASAKTLEQAALFKWVWASAYNTGNPQYVLDGLTRKIIDAHMHVTQAYNCATGQPPDVATIVHYMLKHNLLHDCRATTHWLDKPMQTVCDTAQIQSCPRATCRQQAGM